MEKEGNPQPLTTSDSKVSLSAWIRQEANDKIPDATQLKEKKNIDYYLSQDGYVETVDKFTMFLDWCNKEGMVMPKLEYPAYFENGLIGVRCKEDIINREAYLFVPFKMMLSVHKVQNDDVLGPIVLDHPECFDEEKGNDWEQLTLAIGLLYEMTKGKESYWYPYLRQMPDVEFSSSWDEHELEMLQDDYCVYQLKEYDAELAATWEIFEKVLLEYESVFPAKFIDRGLFLNIYGQVCTRCFGYGLESTAMIPMADNLNHSSVDITNEMICLSLHPQGDRNIEYYRIGKYLADYSQVYAAQGWSEEDIKKNKLNICGRYSR